MELNEILQLALRAAASDIHLKAGLPPSAYKEKDAQLFCFTGQVFGEKELGRQQ